MRCSVRKAFTLRSYSIDPALKWAALRFAKFMAHWARGTLRRFLPAGETIDEDSDLAAPTWARGTPVHK